MTIVEPAWAVTGGVDTHLDTHVAATRALAARVESGELAGRVIPLAEPEYLIGRHRDNGIQIPDIGVSGFHARIYRGPDGFTLEDLKSRNGTWINGTRIYHATLSNGDRVHLGQRCGDGLQPVGGGLKPGRRAEAHPTSSDVGQASACPRTG